MASSTPPSRHLADRVGRETAALFLRCSRPFHAFPPVGLSPNGAFIDSDGDGSSGGEIDAGCYPDEEQDGNKKYRQTPEEDPVFLSQKDVDRGEEKKLKEESENQRYKNVIKRDAREGSGGMIVDGRVVVRMNRYDLAAVQPSMEEV